MVGSTIVVLFALILREATIDVITPLPFTYLFSRQRIFSLTEGIINETISINSIEQHTPNSSLEFVVSSM